MGSNQTAIPRVIIIMGVAGAGKTEVGSRLAARLGARFFDADAFHPPENIKRMSAGLPLTDADRWPWFDRMRREVVEAAPPGQTWILACSALKKRYRDHLRRSGEHDVVFVFLDGDYDTIFKRMSARTDHFMKEGMLKSQFEALEPPDKDEAIVVSIDHPPINRRRNRPADVVNIVGKVGTGGARSVVRRRTAQEMPRGSPFAQSLGANARPLFSVESFCVGRLMGGTPTLRAGDCHFHDGTIESFSELRRFHDGDANPTGRIRHPPKQAPSSRGHSIAGC